MEAAAQEEVNTTSKDHTVVVKGKRTKRQRLQSPIPFAVAAATNSYGGENNNNHHNSSNSNNSNNISNNSSSPTSSAKLQDISTEEEEDMANCLILLAHGQSHAGSSASLKVQPPIAGTKDGGGSNFKYSSRKFLEETNAFGAGKAGYYLYECKTCNRTFPSFQALGGHRASHKKPKAMAEIEKKTQLFALQSDDKDQSQLIKSNNTISSTSLSLQLSARSLYGIDHNNNNHHNNNKKSSNKVHECSICGAEFTSGQALGGHMRRHRAPVGTTSPGTASVATTALSLSTVSATPLMALEANEDDDQQQRHNKKARNILLLDLDLNLPAPEDDQRESEFVFVTSKQQQQQQQQQPQQQPPLVFSAPALVDCHY